MCKVLRDSHLLGTQLLRVTSMLLSTLCLLPKPPEIGVSHGSDGVLQFGLSSATEGRRRHALRSLGCPYWVVRLYAG